MEVLLKYVFDEVNNFHDFVVDSVGLLGFPVDDKLLHFIFAGVSGFVLYIVTVLFIKKFTGISMPVISFLYTLSILLIFSFGLEIEQLITKRGSFELEDVIFGIWGFITVLGAFILSKILMYIFSFVAKLINKNHPSI